MLPATILMSLSMARSRIPKLSGVLAADGPVNDRELQTRIGKRIRQARSTQGLTIEALARRIGVTKGFVSKLERGEKAPAIGTLINLANALRLDVSALLEPDEAPHRVSYVKKRERVPTTGEATALGYAYASLAHRLKRKHMEPFIMYLPSKPIPEGSGLSHPGEEFVLALSGRTIYRVGSEKYVLEPGDALYFDPSVPHCGWSLGAAASEVLAVTFVKKSR